MNISADKNNKSEKPQKIINFIGNFRFLAKFSTKLAILKHLKTFYGIQIVLG